MNLWVGTPHMVSHHLAKSGCRKCSSRDLMLLEVEGHDSAYSCLSPPFVFISKANGIKAHIL